MSDKAIHLGDGAYASVTEHGDICISSNHHNPEQASNAVYLEFDAATKLITFLKKELGYE